jgi:DNA polymerase-1
VTTLLIDGDTVVYRFACGGQKSFDWGNGVVSSHTDLSTAVKRVDSYVELLQERLKGDQIIMALTDPEHNYRKDILPTYKGLRPAEKPIMWADLRAHVQSSYRSYIKPSLEGDDILGILATHPKLVPGKKVIVAIDKDMRTVPALHHNPDTGKSFEVDEPTADYWHLFQTLTGDVVDCYAGCPGIGPVKAERIIGGPDFIRSWGVEPAWRAVVETFEKRGLTAEDALVQARVARILRTTDYDFKAKRPILWRP